MKKTPRRRRISQETEINALLLLSLGIIALVISCALLTVTLTDGHGNLVATIETISVSTEAVSVTETDGLTENDTENGNEVQAETEGEADNQTATGEQAETDNGQTDGYVEVDVSVEYTSGEMAEENSSLVETEEATVSESSSIGTESITQQGVTRYIFVGDSRYVGMSVLAQEDDYFIAEEGKGYYYMVEHEEDIKAAIIPGAVLIVGMGVNDVQSNITILYIQKINEWAKTLGISIYYMLVNPVDEAIEAEHGYDVTNEEIDEFNATLQAGLDSSVHIIDTNSYLKGDGFVTGDGVHYNTETYEKIYTYIRGQVQITEDTH